MFGLILLIKDNLVWVWRWKKTKISVILNQISTVRLILATLQCITKTVNTEHTMQFDNGIVIIKWFNFLPDNLCVCLYIHISYVPKRKLRFPTYQISWVSDWMIDWLTDWLSTRFFSVGELSNRGHDRNKIWHHGSLGGEDDARTSNTCIAQRKRVIPQLTMKTKCYMWRPL